ncbi:MULTISPECIES: HNH endonuclease family protein [Streptomyces]|uniref:HNH endonuclease family protein n=1 Tax=Streptomyces cremeus TaxID=66881 RepID=A0ABV5PCL6_STRCM
MKTAALLFLLPLLFTSSPAAPPVTVTTTLHAAVAALPKAADTPAGYTAAEFTHWTDEDQDGCNTRSEVLLEEATTPPAADPRCVLTGGAWHSYYDKKDHTTATSLAVDHLVPLADAWRSGAAAWSPDERRRFANDTEDPRTLAAITSAEDRLKGDRDPAHWEPSDDGADCRYVAEWTAVKSRWRLTADAAEHKALTTMAAECPEEPLTYTHAR